MTQSTNVDLVKPVANPWPPPSDRARITAVFAVVKVSLAERLPSYGLSSNPIWADVEATAQGPS